MGEARRRKLLDPNFGKDRYIHAEINGRNVQVKQQIYIGYLTPTVNEDEFDLNIDATDDELYYLEAVLAAVLSPLIEKYNYAKQKYKFVFDAVRLFTKRCGTISLYPAHWDSTLPQIRNYRYAIVELKEVMEETTELTTDNKSDTRKSPKEHIRKTHRRRVAYGKNRSLRKWVEIKETIVSPA